MNWHTYFNYSEGKIFWNEKPSFKTKLEWNGKTPGKEAGTLNLKGYVNVKLNKKMYKAHRIIWEMHNGQIPNGMQIDHINRVRDDNRIENLRLATNQANQRNYSKKKNNTTGFNGVAYHKLTGKCYAHVGVDGKTKFSRLFETIDEAIKERDNLSSLFGFDKNHGLSSQQ